MPSVFQILEAKTLLLLNHCPAHSEIERWKDKAVVLPKNMTALIQPMD
jgi:hypothetical protein